VASNLSRRQFLKKVLGGLAVSAGACLGCPGYTALVEPRWLVLERSTVYLEGLGPHLEGFRLALLSDFHLGPHVERDQVARAVEMALGLESDLLVLAGDFVSSAPATGPCAEEMARLNAPAGVVACLGNHDHWTDPEAVAGALAEAGVEVLRNRALEVADGLWVAGVDDVWERQADLDAALSGVPAGATMLLLAHEPDFADLVAADGRTVLQLSGHTHGGQVRLPLVGPPILPYLGRRYPAGLYTVGRMQLYVSRGVGLISPPIRLNCRPEVTLLELRPA
jgi:predicted MPP superfamily phosphohydrolase